MKPETFKKRYPRHYWALQNMEAGNFKDNLQIAFETGKMSNRMLNSLWRKADELEFRKQAEEKGLESPNRGVFVDKLSALITKMDEGRELVDKRTGEVHLVDRILFLTSEGWRGWVDFPTETSKLFQKLLNRTTDCVRISGSVVWRKPDVAILSDSDFLAEEM